MIKTRLLTISLLLALLGTPLIALAASNISNALYYGTVQVSNNSTAAANVATTGNITTANLINDNYLNSSANNCVVRSSSGADIPFMPSVNASYPWCFWVPSIGANSYLNYILYTANSTGGEIRYFPGAAGMATPDNDATLELSANFTIEQKGWIDTSAVGDNITSKEDAFRIYVSGTGNITSAIYNPTTLTQVAQDTDLSVRGGVRTRVGFRYDNFLAGTITSVEFYLKKTGLPTGTANITVRKVSDDSIIGLLGTLDVSTLGAGYAYLSFSDDVEVDTTQHIRICFEYSGGDAAKYPQMGYRAADVEPLVVRTIYLDPAWTDSAANDVTFKLYHIAIISVTAPGLSSGEYRVTTTANVTHMWTAINGVTANTTALGGVSVPDNSANWTFCEAAMPYLEYQEITIDGVQAQYIEWEYSDNFTDQSANNNYAIPTFRTASSDADVSASLTAFLPISEAKAPDYALGEAPAFIDADALTGNITSTFTTTPGTSTGTFPLAGVITAMANATSIPPQLPLLIIAAFIIIAGSLSVSAIIRRHGSGSLIVKSIVIVALMGIFVALGDFAIDFWMIGVFLVLAVAMAFASRQLGWT